MTRSNQYHEEGMKPVRRRRGSVVRQEWEPESWRLKGKPNMSEVFDDFDDLDIFDDDDEEEDDDLDLDDFDLDDLDDENDAR